MKNKTTKPDQANKHKHALAMLPNIYIPCYQ